MQLRAKALGRVGVAALLAAVLLEPGLARAEADHFGVGDGHHGAKTVAGNETINSYASITADVAAGATQIQISTVIGAPGGFAANDLVMVWRTTGVAASAAPSGNQSRIDLSTAPATVEGGTEAGLVGTYEFARVASVAGSTITLTAPLLRGYAKHVSQVVKIPEYTNVTIPSGASIQATAWQEIGGTPANPDPTKPWAGGIVAFMATGEIANNGTIHANGRGFHGGIPEQRILNQIGILCNNQALDGDADDDPFSPKGQGVVHSRYTASSGGKGNVSNAGGGGNCLQGGGGGGANQGNGGNGSGSILGLGAGGFGGVGIDYDVLSRLTMGGGGGAGRHIQGLLSTVSFGGFGGGVVYVRGGSMTGTGRVQANGANGEDSGLLGLPSQVVSEGSGGGGAGGTVVVRLTGTLDCDQLGTAGGNGGSAEVIGLGIFGAGGGGGGGRVLFQAETKSDTCNVSVAPGAPGNDGQGGSQGGTPGVTQPPPTGGFCFDSQPGGSDPCTGTRPVCDTTTGECNACSGPFGGGSPHACKVAVKPVCQTDGSCVACNGDLGSGSSASCQLADSPHCFTTGGSTVVGSCGKCTSNADCAGHPGPICNVNTGSCGTTCTTDADCKPTEWCAPQDSVGGTVCTPKTPNGQPLPPFPPIDGECTEEKGNRACLSGKCEPEDDLCGLGNGSPCGAPAECRSEICFEGDELCGLPNGEPCTENGQCRSAQCKDGACTSGCKEDSDCKAGQICDGTNETCVPGCRPTNASTPDAGPHGGCPPGEECVAANGAPVGQCQPLGDGGTDGGGSGGGGDAGYGGGDGGLDLGANPDFGGIVEGGGCACNSTSPSSASPLAIFGALAGVAAAVRRRLRTRATDRAR